MVNLPILILPLILIISPFILILASRQDKGTKKNIRLIFILFLVLELILGFFNWESFSKDGLSGYQLALAYPSSLLFAFFALTLSQTIILVFAKRFLDILATILNFANLIILFAALISISNILGFQTVGWANLGTIFLVLFANIAGLALINKDSNLLSKFPWSHESVEYAKKHNIKQTKFQEIATWVLFSAVIVFIAAMLFLHFNKTKDETSEQTPQASQETLEESLSQEDAIARVRGLAEVKSYLEQVPNARVEIDSFDQETNTYLVHVYEIKNGHTATFNWYTINQKTGKITPQFDNTPEQGE